MLKKKKTTASGKLVLVKSVRRTRSHRIKFCVQEWAWERCPQQADGRKCECVLTLALLAGFVCGYPHALLATVVNNPNSPCAAAKKHSKFKYSEVTSMGTILPCEFNLATACVELRLDDGTLLSIDCTAVENEVANSMY